jgi:hypothetical protein
VRPLPLATATAAAATAVAAAVIGLALAMPAPAAGIPAFSRTYRTGCLTCHVAPGKLNAQGEAFRLNGYRFPADDEARLRQDEPVPLGAEPWKELWPDAVWPGEIPGALPLSLSLANELRVGRDDEGGTALRYAFPAVVALHAGTALASGIGAFVVATLRPGAGVQLAEAKALVQDPLPWLPPRALNVRIGLQRPHLLTLGDRGLDQLARTPALWQRLQLADWTLEPGPAAGPLPPLTTLRLGAARPAIELDGLAAGRLYYALGLAQPAAPAGRSPRASDGYVRLRAKLDGLGLDGRAPAGGDAVAWGGQLLDRGLIVEGFAHVGEAALTDGSTDRHRAFGAAARLLAGRVDVGAGHVRGRHTAPWGAVGPAGRHASSFARAEAMARPWLIASLRAEQTRLTAPARAPAPAPAPASDRASAFVALTALVHQNVRAVAETELRLRDRPSHGRRAGADDEASGAAVWLRLDVAF